MLGQLARSRPSPAAGAGAAARAGGRRPRGSVVRVVGEHPLPVGLLGQLGDRRGRLERERELPSSPPSRRSRAAGRADSQSSSRRGAERSQAPDATSASSAARLDRRALREVARRRRTAARRRPPRPPPRRPTGCSRGRPAPRRPSMRAARGAAAFTSGGQHLHPAPLAVADEARRRVEAHRLGVQQRAEELGRVVVAQPRGLVGEQRERGRVRLREAEAREADELVVDAVGGLAVDALRRARPRRTATRSASIASSLRLRLIARRSPSASPTVKPASAIATSSTWSWKTTTPSVSRSGSAQRRVVDRRHERRVLAEPLAVLDVRVDGPALDRPGPDERDLDRQVVEVLRPRAQQALHLRAALDLEVADGVGALDLGVDRPGRRAGCARGRSSRRAGARSGRRSPRPRRASRGRAGRSSGSRRRRRSPCPTGRSGGPPSPPAARGRARRAAASRSPSRPGAGRCGAAGRRSRARASPSARQRGASAWLAGQPLDLLGDAVRVPLGDAREPLELGGGQAERLADVADRAARVVGREARRRARRARGRSAR